MTQQRQSQGYYHRTITFNHNKTISARTLMMTPWWMSELYQINLKKDKHLRFHSEKRKQRLMKYLRVPQCSSDQPAILTWPTKAFTWLLKGRDKVPQLDPGARLDNIFWLISNMSKLWRGHISNACMLSLTLKPKSRIIRFIFLIS